MSIYFLHVLNRFVYKKDQDEEKHCFEYENHVPFDIWMRNKQNVVHTF